MKKQIVNQQEIYKQKENIIGNNILHTEEEEEYEQNRVNFIQDENCEIIDENDLLVTEISKKGMIQDKFTSKENEKIDRKEYNYYVEQNNEENEEGFEDEEGQYQENQENYENNEEYNEDEENPNNFEEEIENQDNQIQNQNDNYNKLENTNHSQNQLQENQIYSNQEYTNPQSTSYDEKINLVDINLKISQIFEYYSSFGDRVNLKFMGSTKYFKFALDCELIKSYISKPELDIIFSKVTKNSSKMSLDQFSKSLVLLSHYYSLPKNKNKEINESQISKNSKMNKSLKTKEKKNELILFLEEIIIPFHSGIFDKKLQHTNEDTFITADYFTTDEELMALLECSSSGLYSIYKTYFKHELSLAQDLNFIVKSSNKMFFQFLKDFDISPTLVNKSQCISIYSNLSEFPINSEEAYFKVLTNVDLGKVTLINTNCSNILGSYFSFFKFIRILVKLALTYFEYVESQSNVKLTLFDKMLYLLEKIEGSQGFNELEKKTHITHTSKTNFLFDRKIVTSIKNSNKKILDTDHSKVIYTADNYQKINSNQNIRLNSGLASPISTNYHSNLETERDNNKDKENIDFLIENYGRILLQIFECYCSFGSDKKETKYMKSPNFYKLLKDSGLITEFPSSGMFQKETFFKSRIINQNTAKLNNFDSFAPKNKSGRPLISVNSLKQKTNSKEESQNDEFSLIKIDSNEVDLIFTTIIKFQARANSEEQNITNNNNTVGHQSFYCSKMIQNENINYKKILTVKGSKSVTFKSFVQGITIISSHLISKKKLNNSNNEISQIIVEKIIKNNEKLIEKNVASDNKIELLEALKKQSEDDLNLINVLSSTVESIYLFYSFNKDSKEKKTRGLMTFMQLSQFCLDFQIFPDLISKSKLLFYYKKKYLEIQYDLIKKFGIYDTEFIDFSGFTDILALIAIDLPLEDEQFINRVTTVVEHLSQSGGEEKIYIKTNKKTVPLLFRYKSFLPDYFSNVNESITVDGFNEILQS